MRRVLLCSACLLLSPLASGLAQVASLSPGQRIRLSARAYEQKRVQGTLVSYDLNRAQGTLIGIDPEAILFRTARRHTGERDRGDSVTLELPLVAITRIEVVQGRRSNWDRGALWGLAVGGGLGLVGGIAYTASGCVLGCDGQEGGVVAATTMTLGFLGAAIGAAVGAASSRDTWRAVPLGRPRVGVHPTPTGVGVGVAFRF